jgi:hypothetical protein
LPSADFYGMVKVNRFTLSHDSVTCRRSPEVSSTAFDGEVEGWRDGLGTA